MKITVYNKLKKYESYLYTAYKADYIRGLTSKQVEDLITAGNEINIFYKHNGCPKCLLNFIKKLAKPYFEQQEKLEQKKKDRENENK